MEHKNYIYVNGFWNGFVDKTDANTISFFETLFKKSDKLSDFEITTDLNKANVLFESLFGRTLSNNKKWKYKLHYSGEPYTFDCSNYDVVMYSSNEHEKYVCVPLYAYYIHNNNFLHKLVNRPVITEIPKKFCCFIVSNGHCKVRNKMFDILNSYKRVDSLGKFNNNCGGPLLHDYWTEEYRNFIGQYKFIICFENTKIAAYSTEKIINPYLASIIPIYWSSHVIKTMFNKDSMVFLEDESEISYKKVLNTVIELDNNDEKYLEFVNQKNIINTEYWDKNFTIEKIAKQIDDKLT